METPTVPQIKEWSELDFAELGQTDAKLERLVRLSARDFERITGLPLANVPPEDEEMVGEVVRGLTEQRAYQKQAERLEALSDWDLISSFSAGPYSETRRSPDDMRKARMVNPIPELNEALWGFMTPERQTYWLEFFSDTPPPAFMVTHEHWGAMDTYSTHWPGDEPMWGPDA